MPDREDLPRLNEMITIIDRYAPERLTELRRRFPESSDLLSQGITMGSGSAKRERAAEAQRSIAALEASRDFLEIGASLLPLYLQQIAVRIERADRTKLVADVATAAVALLTGNGAILLSNAQQRGLWIAAFTGISSLALIARGYLGRPSPFGDDPPALARKKVVDCYVKTLSVLREIDVWRAVHTEYREHKPDARLVEAAAELAESISRFDAVYRVSPLAPSRGRVPTKEDPDPTGHRRNPQVPPAPVGTSARGPHRS